MMKRMMAGLIGSLLLVCGMSSTLAAADSTAVRTYSPAQIREMGIAPDLQERMQRWKKVEMPFTSADFSAREKKLFDELVAASRDLESAYWRQSDPVALGVYKSLAGTKDPELKTLRQYLMINGSRWDLVSENEPFLGHQPMPPGRYLLPQDMTSAQIEAYVAAHPTQKANVYDEHRVVRGDASKLTTTPYHVEYAPFVRSAANHLRSASRYADDKAFANFLRLRADALLTDDYYESDLAWVKLENPRFDIIFAPYESYLDNLLGVKTSYGAAVMIRNEPESKKLEVFQKYVPDIQQALPLGKDDLPDTTGHRTPMEVMDTPFRAGDLRHGYQAVADNLPNDPRIHEKVGTKKIFFKNFMDARVDYVILPLAKHLMRADQASKASAEGYLAGTMMHEICHGLGPSFSRTSDGRKDIREAIGSAYSGLEEAKADVCGMYSLKWLVDHGALEKSRLEEYYASYVAGIFRTLRFGTGEAHGRAEMMEFNYYREQGAITRDAATARYVIDYAKLPGAIAAVTKELLEQEATGDRARSEAWFKKYDVMPPDLTAALLTTKDVPIDIDPLNSLSEPVR
ncbi:MAG: Zn-dependent hydrolase [Acidobacteriota bacterium]